MDVSSNMASSMVSTPSMPSMDSTPSMPSMDSAPSMPSMDSVPSVPSMDSTPSYSAPAPSFDMSSLGGSSFGSSFGGGSFSGGMSLMGGGSRSTNYKPPTSSNDESAVSGLLAEVEKLTGKHVKKHSAHQDSSDAQQPAFARDFDDDDDSASSPEESHRQKVHEMSWGQVIPGTMSSMIALQQPAPMAPQAPVAPPMFAPPAP